VKILVAQAHTGCDASLATLGHEFHGIAGTQWDEGERPIPDNWKIVPYPEPSYDLRILQRPHDFKVMADSEGPALLHQLNDGSEGTLRPETEEKLRLVIFLNQDVADRWEMQDPTKKRVIRMAADPSFFQVERREDGRPLVTIGHSIPKRWDKGFMPLKVMSQVFMRITVAGPENEELPGNVGPVDLAGVRELLGGAKVYFNPGPIIGISVAEAMAAGCPVVSMRPINLTRELRHGENVILTDTLDGAMSWVRRLMKDAGHRRALGDAARQTARELFSLDRFQREWSDAINTVAQPKEIAR